MGYYDDHDFYGPSKRKREKRGSTFLTAIIASILGGLIVLMMLPTLLKAGIIDIPQSGLSNTDNRNNLNAQPVSANPTKEDTGNADIVEAVAIAEEAVVGVINYAQMQNPWSREKSTVQQGTGTGVVFKKDDKYAYVVTNNHVIAKSAEVAISLSDKETIKAEVIGADEYTDLAVLRVDSSKVNSVAQLGSSDELLVGQTAIAIGNPLGFSKSVTVGVISALNRAIPIDLDKNGQDDWEINVIQTDAAINPGNSGGALINIRGEVIGINTLKIAQEEVEGLGFAIPISEAKPIIEDLMESGKVKRPLMGIVPLDLAAVPPSNRSSDLDLPNDVNKGVVIYTAPTGAAARAGLKQYDVIVKLDDEEIASSMDLRKYLFRHKQVGDRMKVTFYRDGELQTATITLTEATNN